ncbi:MAG: HugZ family protein [Arenicella sp.]
MKKEIEQKVSSLIENQQSLLLSTIDNQHNSQTYSSYAPYFCDVKEGAFYVLLSGLAEHTQNLIDQPRASMLIIEDESKSEQIFARVRVQYEIRAEMVLDVEIQRQVFHKMKERFGEVVDVLQSLSDFNVFRLSPIKGRYIEGFGKAISIDDGMIGGLSPVMQSTR